VAIPTAPDLAGPGRPDASDGTGEVASAATTVQVPAVPGADPSGVPTVDVLGDAGRTGAGDGLASSMGATDSGGAPDGLRGELAAAAGRPWRNKWTMYLAAAVLLLAGFITGVQVQKSYGASGSAGGFAASGRAGRGGGGFGGFPGGAAGLPSGAPGAVGGRARSTTGTVKLVDGSTIYVQTADGTVVTVRTDAGTAIQIAKRGALTDLKAGDTVTVDGSNSGGTVTATTVTSQAK
jgi:hypothetical protein